VAVTVKGKDTPAVTVAGGVPGDLRQRCCIRACDGAAARHCFQHGLAEPLVERREDERGGTAVEIDELVLRDESAYLDSFGGGVRVAPAGEHES